MAGEEGFASFRFAHDPKLADMQLSGFGSGEVHWAFRSNPVHPHYEKRQTNKV